MARLTSGRGGSNRDRAGSWSSGGNRDEALAEEPWCRCRSAHRISPRDRHWAAGRVHPVNNLPLYTDDLKPDQQSALPVVDTDCSLAADDDTAPLFMRVGRIYNIEYDMIVNSVYTKPPQDPTRRSQTFFVTDPETKTALHPIGAAEDPNPRLALFDANLDDPLRLGVPGERLERAGYDLLAGVRNRSVARDDDRDTDGLGDRPSRRLLSGRGAGRRRLRHHAGQWHRRARAHPSRRGRRAVRLLLRRIYHPC